MDGIENQLLGRDGEVVARANLTLCFFGKTDAPSWSKAGRAALDAWHGQVPAGALTWASLGASSSKYTAAGPGILAKCSKQLQSGKSTASKSNSLFLRGPQMHGADYEFNWTYLKDAADPEANGANLLEMRFPVEHLKALGCNSFVEWLSRVAAPVPFDSGYVAFSWSPARESTESQAGKRLGALALRHAGLDVSINRSTHFEIARRCRGAQWMVFLSDGLVQRVGGIGALAGSLTRDGHVDQCGGGVMIRTSVEPRTGDTNRNDKLTDMQPLARLLEPITYFGDYSLDILFNDDEDMRHRWERRYLDQSGA